MLRYVRSLGIGPLYEDPPSGAPTGDPAPGAPAPDDKSGGGGGGTAPATGTVTPSGGSDPQMIPYARFAQVNGELVALRKEKEERDAAEAKQKGEHEKLYETEKTKREAAEARVLSIARRAAFIGTAAGKVSDPEAAYKLAQADGMLDAIEVDDTGSSDPKVVGKIVEDLTKKYEFLKSTNNRSFGDPKDGQPPAPPADPSKLSSRQLLELGYRGSGSGSRS